MDKKLKIAFIGAGWQCINRHIPHFANVKNVELYGVIDSNTDQAKKVAEKWKMPFFSTENEVNNIPWFTEVDAVAITTPPMTHYHWIKQALIAGKHILTEKPFSTQREHGEELLSLAEQKKLQLNVVQNTLFSRGQKKARRYIKSGKIGEITGLSISLLNNPNRHLPIWYDELPCGLLFDELSHMLYTTASLVPDLQVENAEMYVSRNGLKNTPSKARMSLLSPNFPIFFSMDFESPICEWHTQIQGTKGLLDVDNFRDIVIFIPNDRTHKAIDHARTVWHVISDLIGGFIGSGIAFVSGTLNYGMKDVVENFVQNCCSKPDHEMQHNESDYISGKQGVKIFNLLCDCIDKLTANTSSAAFNLKLPKPESWGHVK